MSAAILDIMAVIPPKNDWMMKKVAIKQSMSLYYNVYVNTIYIIIISDPLFKKCCNTPTFVCIYIEGVFGYSCG